MAQGFRPSAEGASSERLVGEAPITRVLKVRMAVQSNDMPRKANMLESSGAEVLALGRAITVAPSSPEPDSNFEPFRVNPIAAWVLLAGPASPQTAENGQPKLVTSPYEARCANDERAHTNQGFGRVRNPLDIRKTRADNIALTHHRA